MRFSLFLFLFLIWGALISVSEAQVSFGGSPISFGSDFQRDSRQAVLPTVSLPVLDMLRIRQEDSTQTPNRFAVATEVAISPETTGFWQILPTGDRLWRVMLEAQDENVYGMVLLFSQFSLPEKSKLFVYTPDKKTVLGAFTHQNNHFSNKFSIELIKSRQVIIEYYEPAFVVGKPIIGLDRIDQAYRKLPPPTTFRQEKNILKTQDFGQSGNCNLNINCTPLANDWQDEKRGIVRILVVNALGSTWCSGSLINNTYQDNKPYLLTAAHCAFNTSATHISQWIFYFQYEITDCNAPTVEPTSPTLTGATLRAQFGSSDFYLLELNQEIPLNYNVYFNGWDRTGTNYTGSVGIHHPSGDVKKFSRDVDAVTTTAYSDDTNNSGSTHYRVVWNEGVTEGGSSGSPLLNNNGLIVGQLHGGGSACNALTEADWYGKVSRSWTGGGTANSRLSDWLDAGNLGVTSLQGKDANGITAKFTTNIEETIYLPNQVIFTDASLGNVTSYFWDFGEGAIPATANTAGPHIVTYSTLGKKKVSLSVNNGFSKSFKNLYALPAVSLPYQKLHGGNIETNPQHFLSVTLAGTGFERGKSTITGKQDTTSGDFAWVTGVNAPQYMADSYAMLYTPSFDLSLDTSYRFSFNLKMRTDGSSDGLIVQYSINQGKNWSQLGTTSTNFIDWYNTNCIAGGAFPLNTPLFSAQNSAFENKKYDISFLKGNSSVGFRFIFRSDNLNMFNTIGLAIDDIEVFIPDLKPPLLVSTIPAHNATNVLSDAELALFFNEPVSAQSQGIQIKRLSDNQTWNGFTITSTGSTVLIKPQMKFTENTEYYVEISGNSIFDIYGNKFQGFAGNNVWRFRTSAQTILPTFTKLEPMNLDTLVALETNLAITFDEQVQRGAGKIFIKKISDNSIFETIDITSNNITIAQNIVTINPTNAFAPLTRYYIEIEAGAIRDLVQNNFSGFTGNHVWQFRTKEENKPFIINYLPAHNATNVSVESNLILTFNEPIRKNPMYSNSNTFFIAIRRASNQTLHENINILQNVTIEGNVLTIKPTIQFQPLTKYCITIYWNDIQDLYGNPFQMNCNTWQFTTGTDNIPPRILSLSPTNNAIDVSIYTQLSLTFQEEIKKGAGNITIKKWLDDAVVEDIDITSAQVLLNKNVVTVSLNNTLAIGTAYYVTVSQNAFQDLSNIPFAGLVGKDTWTFTTSDNVPPTIISFSPTHQRTDVSVETNLVLTFQEKIKKGTGKIDILRASDGNLQTSILVGSPEVSILDNKVTINPMQDLGADTKYYVTVSSDAFQDLSNNYFAGFQTNNIWQFTTGLPTALEQDLEKNIQLFPNPTSDNLHLALPEKGLKEVTITLYDVVGKVVWQQKWAYLPSAKTISLSTLPKGMYALVVTTHEGQASWKVIKQ
jgi:PKD repeat protein/methionine-rich copper-binding protein CopC